MAIEETGIVEMYVRAVTRHRSRDGDGDGPRYGWECAACQAQTGLVWDLRHVAEAELAEHLRTEHAAAYRMTIHDRRGNTGSSSCPTD